MLSHMLFNRLKWWNVDDNADKATINGRDYIATPKKIRVPAGAQVTSDLKLTMQVKIKL